MFCTEVLFIRKGAVVCGISKPGVSLRSAPGYELVGLSARYLVCNMSLQMSDEPKNLCVKKGLAVYNLKHDRNRPVFRLSEVGLIFLKNVLTNTRIGTKLVEIGTRKCDLTYVKRVYMTTNSHFSQKNVYRFIVTTVSLYMLVYRKLYVIPAPSMYERLVCFSESEILTSHISSG